MTHRSHPALAAALLTLLFALPAPAQDDPAAIRAYVGKMKEIFAWREKIRDIHPVLAKLYPVAIAEGKKLLVFEPDEPAGAFVFRKSVPEPFPIPQGIRAAFPLEALGGNPACVVSGEVFEEPAGYVFIFHEFVHCAQWADGERALKERLGVYRDAMARKDYSWELNHPFPYADPPVTAAYTGMLKALGAGEMVDDAAVRASRADLRRLLKTPDFEYMVWQEWKEGLARHLENRIRERLGFAANRGGATPPYDRVLFYAGGAALIGWLSRKDPAVPVDLEKTFEALWTL